MKIFFVILFLTNNLILFSQWEPSDLVLSKKIKELDKIYDSNYDIIKTDFNSNYFNIIIDNKQTGYLCLRQAPSKHDVFDYMLIFDNDLNIDHMKILAYREDWGGEIRSKRWLKQFSNREIEDVQAISGATISVNSLKTDISKLKSEMSKWLK